MNSSGNEPVDVHKKVSVIIPAMSEEATLPTLVERIDAVFANLSSWSHEIILVDDGSTDDTWRVMVELASTNAAVRSFKLRRNFGKATALSLGVTRATGDVCVTMDADLQDDPKEIPRFLEQLENYDLVSGWKRRRHDPFSKTIPSKLFNLVTRVFSGVKLRDFNCGFKAARREVYAKISLYGELHRYIPVLANNLGYRIGEIPVEHHPRSLGQSKYGFDRYLRGFLDLLTILTITRYGRRPGHLFGGLGFVSGIVGFGILAYLTGIWILTPDPIGDRPLLLLGIMLEILSVQLLSLGMLAELVLHRTRSPSVDGLVAAEVEGDQELIEHPQVIDG